MVTFEKKSSISFNKIYQKLLAWNLRLSGRHLTFALDIEGKAANICLLLKFWFNLWFIAQLVLIIFSVERPKTPSPHWTAKPPNSFDEYLSTFQLNDPNPQSPLNSEAARLFYENLSTVQLNDPNPQSPLNSEDARLFLRKFIRFSVERPEPPVPTERRSRKALPNRQEEVRGEG